MKITYRWHSTLPSKKNTYSQIVFFPNAILFSSMDDRDRYEALTFEWLFWSFTILFRKNGKSKAE